VVSSTPRPHFTPGKDPLPILQEAGWAPGRVWTGGKSRPHWDPIPDRPARSSVAIPTELPGQLIQGTYNYMPETNHVTGVYRVTAVLYLQFVLRGNVISHVKCVLYLYFADPTGRSV